MIQDNNGRITPIDDIRKWNPKMIYAVGDYTCKLLEENNIDPQLMVYDLTTERGMKTYADRKDSIAVQSGQGEVSSKLIQTIEEFFRSKERMRIRVIGEEDLAVLPIIFYAPFNSLVVYGIPGIGTGSIIVNKQSKELTEKIFEKMEVK